ncbi:hypothetical protein GBAR_LOCUS10014 [Geodia barretti]|uniref:Uncharacterized protein n=1 Tax=Geodia barretti TaxID=519541 RepID=A0AA35WCG6_GEOBA|nr:hypothetical protein GBAR_LOCUS10014 [Geodia barretti]
MQPSPVPIPALVQTVISCVRLLCERLLYVEPPSLSDAINHLRQTCKPTSCLDDNIGGVAIDGQQREDEYSDKEEKIRSPVNRTSVTRAGDVLDDYIIGNEDDITDEGVDNSGGGIVEALELVREGVHHLVTMYCLSLLPGYLPEWWAEPKVRTLPLGQLHYIIRTTYN